MEETQRKKTSKWLYSSQYNIHERTSKNITLARFGILVASEEKNKLTEVDILIVVEPIKNNVTEREKTG